MSNRPTLYRDPSRGRIAGVCAGISEYFGIELWLVRILLVAACLLSAGTLIFVGYVAAWFILEKKPTTAKAAQQTFSGHGQSTSSGKGWHNTNTEEAEKVVVKSKIWQAGEPPKKAFFDIKQQFENNEERLRKVETYVTSSEFQLNREINNL
ncbi:envelope stress response membrane protein PspC [Paraglaciecola sp. 2405UD69-4]|uniref:envelope stress response membrane protein PspC n=1 Tax=Paraglaciecola sp. 2405UD69-4 TaxID=3391836 RepID=UPI0039C90E24